MTLLILRQTFLAFCSNTLNSEGESTANQHLYLEERTQKINATHFVTYESENVVIILASAIVVVNKLDGHHFCDYHGTTLQIVEAVG